MASLFILPTAGESDDSFAERRSGAGVSVCNDALRDSVEEPECVELVEQRFCGRQRAGWGVRQLIEDAPRSLIEFWCRKNPGDEPDRFRLLSRDDATGTYEVEGNLFTDRAAEHRHHHGGYEADRHLRIRELGLLMRQHDVAGVGEACTAGERASFHERNDGLLHAPDSVEDVAKSLGVFDVLLTGSVDHLLQCGEIGAGAEIGTFTVDGDDAYPPLTQSKKRLGKLVGCHSVERVFLLGTRESDEPDGPLDRHDDVIHRDFATRDEFAAGSPRRAASASGTSIIIRNSAVEYTLPCASVLSDNVPPPSSAPCSRKLSAFRFGSSKRSTSPSIIPRKCSATRSTVTLCVRSSYHSGLRAMTPTLAVSPLSPERACARSTSCAFTRRPRLKPARRICRSMPASMRRSLPLWGGLRQTQLHSADH